MSPKVIPEYLYKTLSRKLQTRIQADTGRQKLTRRHPSSPLLKHKSIIVNAKQIKQLYHFQNTFLK